jgi:hypothetical protein
MGQEVDCCASDQYLRAAHRSPLLAMMLSAACILQFGSEARAQCAAQDVLQSQLNFKKAFSATEPQASVRFATDVPVWKTITLGSFANSLALRNELDARGCNVGGLAAEVLARPDFVVKSAKTEMELVAVSAAELGFKTDTVTLAAVYARARQLGLGLAAAEVGPQLRLQYFDQPVGEFLIVGMEPIMTWSGEAVILNVANGGAGLVLIGQDGRAEAEISVTSRILFVSSKEAVPADALETAAIIPPPPSSKKKSPGAPELKPAP